MNRTLFDCGVKKKVETKTGGLFDVTATLPKSTRLLDKPVKCDIYQESFATKKYLDTHVRFKHCSENARGHSSLGKAKDTSFFDTNNGEGADTFASDCIAIEIQTEGSDDDSGITLQAESKRQPTAIANRRGQNKRKSYTVEFKMKTLELLDSLSGSKKKWQKVAKERGINKSLVIKWNKNRNKLLEEIALNKRKKHTRGVTTARQRRKLVVAKAKNCSEQYPLETDRVSLDFKLRRSKGCKVSKLWLKKKMKAKIEICYGKQEAEKFKASNNWFQRFEKRHNISIRHIWTLVTGKSLQHR